MNYYEIEPVDNLFFRDGRPYNMGETQNDVKSMFPPTPHTMVGALRAAMARNMGWTGGSWDERLTSKLGDGNDLGDLRFFGPFLQENDELLFPVPGNVLAQKDGKDSWKNFRKLRPGDEVLSDLETVKFPVLNEELDKMKTISGYIRTTDMQKILSGDDISAIEPLPADNVWKHEFNVGIQREADNLTVPEGGLFSRSMVRLGKNIRLVSGIDRVDETLHGPLMLGGEAKAAFISKKKNFELPKLKGVGNLKEFIAVLITPADLGNLKPDGEVKGLEGVRLVSVCADRPQMIGGWDFKKGPLPLRPHMKAGSVLFCRSDEGIDPKEWNGKMIGNNTEFGFGQILIGKW